VLATLTSGMIFDLTRFPGEDSKGLAAIESLEELDHYTYLVAGCVGPFWTVLHVAHRRRVSDWALREMSEQGVSFGKALQLTNVLRDVPGDLAHGRCYLPARELAALGLGPRDLLEPAGAARALPLYRRLLGLALEHYNVAWDYTLAIPRLEWRRTRIPSSRRRRSRSPAAPFACCSPSRPSRSGPTARWPLTPRICARVSRSNFPLALARPSTAG